MSSSDRVPLEFLAQISGDSEVSSKVRGMGGALGNFGQQAESAGQKTEAFTGSSVKLTTRLKDSALGISTAASAATSLFFQYGNLEKASQRVEKAEVSRLSAESSLAGAQATLNAMVDKGVTSGDRYEAAVLRLESSQARLKTSTKDVELAQGDLSQQQTQFALSVVPTVLGSVSALSSGLKGVSFSAITARFSSLSLAGSSAVLAPALGGTAIASTGLTFSLRGLALAIKGVFVAMGPLGWAIIGIGAAFTAYESNVFGVKDALQGLWKDAFPETKEAASELKSEIAETDTALGKTTDATREHTTSVGLQTTAIGRATSSYKTYQDALAETTKSTDDAWMANLHYLDSIGMLDITQHKTNQQIDFAARFTKNLASETDRAEFANFSLVATHIGLDRAMSLTNAQLTTQAQLYRDVTEEVDSTRTALDALAEAQNRAVVTQFGRQVGLSGVVSPEAAIAAGFGGNAAIMESALAGRLGGVFVAGKGRVLDKGGTLFEDVLGFGTHTGTPHLLHQGEEIVPMGSSALRGGSSGGGSSRPIIVIHTHVELDKREIAHIISKEIAGNLT